VPGAILRVTGLLADEHDAGPLVAFAEHRLRRVAPQVAVAARGRFAPERGDPGQRRP
jgi:hypothetical protein